MFFRDIREKNQEPYKENRPVWPLRSPENHVALRIDLSESFIDL